MPRAAADNEDALVSAVSSHVAVLHPDLIGAMTREDVLAMAQQA